VYGEREAGGVRQPPTPLLEPIVFARRWDRLGGRLVAILNARAIADALNVRFRFIWPRGDDHELDEPRELFDAAFLVSHEIDADDLLHRTILKFDPRQTPAEARQSLFAMEPPPAIEISECFRILALAGEEHTAAAARFRAGLDDIVWSARGRELIEFFRSNADIQGLSAVHVRAGDVVTGDWGHFMAYEKYVPMPFIEAAVVKLSAGGRKPVVVMSDSEPCVAYLRGRHRNLRAPADLYPGYESLSDVQKAFADVLMLSRCRVIVGPKSSAFSLLGANLGAATMVGADRFGPDGRKAQVLRQWIEQGLRARRGAEWLPPFLARDICWYLDVFGETVPRRERLALARRAVDLEPDLVGALARRARLAALSGLHREARASARRAIRQAETVKRHADPLMEALASRVATGCLALLEVKAPRRRRRRLGKLRMLLDRCQSLSPFHMHRPGILQNLRHQLAVLEWVTTPSHSRGANGPGESPPRQRTSGLLAYRNDARFDPVLRDLERVSLRTSRAIAGFEAKRGKSRRRAAPRRKAR
jgi:hypothetical protein